MALVITILLFAGFIYLVDVEILDFVQTRFYNPSVVSSFEKENTVDAEIVQNHILDLQRKFEATLTEPAIRSSFLYNQSADDIYERSRIYGILVESTNGLQAVQFVDSNGIRLHYSTSSRDIMSQSPTSTAYRNYNEDSLSLPFDAVSVSDSSGAKYTMDEHGDRIIFSFPFRDSMDVYRGTALFTVSIRALAEKLIAEGRLKVSDNISVIRDPAGILLGSPEISKMIIHRNVSEIWREGIQGYITLDAEDSGMAFSLISLKTERGIFFGRLVHSYLFSISEPMKLVLKISIFLTFFLTLFFILNLKPNPGTLVRNRIKRLRESLFEQLYAGKSGQDRAKWILELEQRRDEIRSHLKRNLKLRSRQEILINNVIDKSWDELLAVLKVGSGQDIVIQQVKKAPVVQDKEEFSEILEEAEALDAEAAEIEEIDDIEDAEALDAEASEIEEIDEIEELPEENIIDIALSDALEHTQPETLLQSGTRGLLRLASKIANRKTVAAYDGKSGLLWKASKKQRAKAGMGLLAAASSKVESGAESNKYVSGKRGLLAHASEIEINRDYPVTDEVQDFIVEVDIVSPFSSMFSSLSDDSKE
ncbi:MAG: hypothetical protein FWD22_06150 [Treponema sp.]|nr:hypothetical protein [Treponema sp.]